MKLTPVASYRSPRYPTHDYLLDHPELLQLVPKRWRGNRVVLTVLGMTAALMTTRAAAQPSLQPQIIEASALNSDWFKDRPAPVEGIAYPGTDGDKRIAPIFVHGGGREQWAGVTYVAYTLTEEEAQRIIAEEGRRVNLVFLDEGSIRPLAASPDLREIPAFRNHTGRKPVAGEPADSLRNQPWPLDGFDPQHGVGYEFVSEEDYRYWGTYYDNGIAGAADYLEAAVRLQQALRSAQPRPVAGVFYRPDGGRSRTEETLKDPAALKEWESYKRIHVSDQRPMRFSVWYEQYLLRLQVRDFIAWLKAEGII